MTTKNKAIRLSPDEIKGIEAAASAANMSTHAWLRAVVLCAAGVSELPEQLRRVEPTRFPSPPVCDRCGSIMAIETEFEDDRFAFVCPSCAATKDK